MSKRVADSADAGPRKRERRSVGHRERLLLLEFGVRHSQIERRDPARRALLDELNLKLQAVETDHAWDLLRIRQWMANNRKHIVQECKARGLSSLAQSNSKGLGGQNQKKRRSKKSLSRKRGRVASSPLETLQRLFEVEHEKRLPCDPNALQELVEAEEARAQMRFDCVLDDDVTFLLMKLVRESNDPPPCYLDGSECVVSEIDPYGVPRPQETYGAIPYDGELGETDPFNLAASLTGFPVCPTPPVSMDVCTSALSYAKFEPGARPQQEGNVVHRGKPRVKDVRLEGLPLHSTMSDSGVYCVCTATDYSVVDVESALDALESRCVSADRVHRVACGPSQVWMSTSNGILGYALEKEESGQRAHRPSHVLSSHCSDELALLYHAGKVYAGQRGSISGWNVSVLHRASGSVQPHFDLKLPKPELCIHQIQPLFSQRNNSSLCVSFFRRANFFLIDVAKQAPLRWFFGHTAAVESMHCCVDIPELCVTASMDRSCKVWDVRQRRAVLTLEGHHASAEAAVLARVGGVPFVFSGGLDECIKAWDIRANKPLYELSTGNNLVKGLHWSNSARALYCTSASPSERPAPPEWPVDAVRSADNASLRWTLNAHAVIKYSF